MDVAQVLIDGKWRAADAEGTFHAENPAKGEPLPLAFPTSRWSDCDAALTAATKAAAELRTIDPAKIAAFLDAYASNIEASADSIVAAAAEETALPVNAAPQRRRTPPHHQPAPSGRSRSARRILAPRHPRPRKKYPLLLRPHRPCRRLRPQQLSLRLQRRQRRRLRRSHRRRQSRHRQSPSAPPQHHAPARRTSPQSRRTNRPPPRHRPADLQRQQRKRPQARQRSARRRRRLHWQPQRRSPPQARRRGRRQTHLPRDVQHQPRHLPPRRARRTLRATRPGAGRQCPRRLRPVLHQPQPRPRLRDTAQTEPFLTQIAKSFSERPAQPLLSAAGRKQLHQGVTALTSAGAKLVTGGDNAPGDGYRYANTLLRATAAQFLAAPHDLQREIFGNATLAVIVSTQKELESILRLLEGNLTGTIYSAKSGADDATYNAIAPLLREKVGRLLNDKMPTGVAVSPAMNHGGPYPSTSHPGSTSVGIPASITRFAKLDCYDAVRPERLPAILKDTIENSTTLALDQRGLGQGISQGSKLTNGESQRTKPIVSSTRSTSVSLLQMSEIVSCASE